MFYICNFISNIFTIENFWTIIQTILGGVGIYIALLIYKRQKYNTNKDSELNRALATITSLNIDINTGQRKLEHMTNLLRELSLRGDKNGIDMILKDLEGLKVAIDDYYNRRGELMEEYKIKLGDRIR